MKNLLITAALLTAVSGLTQAGEYPKNPIERPLTLADGTIEVIGAYTLGKQHDDDTASNLGFNIRYGITDDWQIGFDGLTYNAYSQDGLSVAVNAGFRGYHDNANSIGDSKGYGAAIFGKQIINPNFAVTFGVNYTYWDEEHIANTKEFDYSIGALMNVAKDMTLFANYTFRDLKDFDQDSANVVGAGLNYTYSKNMDIGMALSYSDFDEQAGGRPFHEVPEKATTVYVAYRF